MGYLGLTPTTAQQNYLNIDDISGSFNGTTTSFALQVGGVAPTPFPVTNSCLISVGGVVQQPDDTGTDGFRISGGNIIFSSAPGTGEDFFGLVLAGADYLNVGANFPDGTVGNPSITFDSDLNTGIYHPSADSIAITSGGTAALTIDSNRRVGLGTSSPVRELEVYKDDSQAAIAITASTTGQSSLYFADTADSNIGGILYTHSDNALAFRVNDAESARIDSSGRLLIGTDSATTIGSAASRIQSEVTSAQWGLSSVRNTNDSLPSAISFAKSRGTAAGSFTAVQNGDGLGALYFYGADGSGYSNLGATISAEVDGTPFSGGDTSDLPGRLVFSTTSDGSGSATERMRITSNGELTLTGNAGNWVQTAFNDGNDVSRYGIRIQCGRDDAAGTNYAMAIVDGNGTAQGYVTFSGGTVTYGTFTAYHPCILPDADNESGYPYGTLLETTSIEYTQKDGHDTERGIVYNVRKTQTANSRAVLGAYGSSMNGGPDGETNRHQALVLGDGHILCNNSGGDIKVGDGICSSATFGIGQKATVSPSMIIGIAQEAVTFADDTEEKLVAVQYGVQQFIPWAD